MDITHRKTDKISSYLMKEPSLPFTKYISFLSDKDRRKQCIGAYLFWQTSQAVQRQ